MRAVAARQKRLEDATRSLAAEQATLRMLVQARTSKDAGSAGEGVRLSGPALPLELPETSAPPPMAGGRDVHLTPIAECPACGGPERSLVCEYNKAIAIGIDIEEPMRRYDYMMCHECGLTYASLRPTGETYQYLFSRFDESLGRTMERPGKKNPLLTPLPLTDAERKTLKARLAHGVFVSEHQELKRSAYVPQLLEDRLANSAHLEVLGSLLSLEAPRVLEIRPRFGAISAGLQRLYGAEAFALAMTEGQAFIMKEAYGIEAAGLIDFDRFTIPFDTTFDLIVGAHMFMHVVRPADFFAEIRRHLAPGGHVYLHKEFDDAEFLEGPMWMFNSMNPFHLQVFDRASLTRALGALGFETVFVGHINGNFAILLRAAGAPIRPAFGDKERHARLAAYQRARDAAVLRLPEQERWRYANEWKEIVERAATTGVAEFDERGRLRLVRQEKRGTPVGA